MSRVEDIVSVAGTGSVQVGPVSSNLHLIADVVHEYSSFRAACLQERSTNEDAEPE